LCIKQGFFRRSIKERAPERYRCMETGDCEISVATRNMCRHCRFQRCLKSGMSASSKFKFYLNIYYESTISYINLFQKKKIKIIQ
jgi:hypothetical protein